MLDARPVDSRLAVLEGESLRHVLTAIHQAAMAQDLVLKSMGIDNARCAMALERFSANVIMSMLGGLLASGSGEARVRAMLERLLQAAVKDVREAQDG